MMSSNRFIFLFISFLLSLCPLAISIFNFSNSEMGVIDLIGSISIMYLLFIAIGVLLNLFVSIISDKDAEFIITPFFGMFSLFMKKVYHSEIGNFYIIGNSDIYVCRQNNFLYMERLFIIKYNGDVEALKKNMRSKLEILYAEELEKIRKKNSIKSWSGAIDLKSERDMKLNEILK
jgi:hypothetical protein